MIRKEHEMSILKKAKRTKREEKLKQLEKE